MKKTSIQYYWIKSNNIGLSDFLIPERLPKSKVIAIYMRTLSRCGSIVYPHTICHTIGRHRDDIVECKIIGIRYLVINQIKYYRMHTVMNGQLLVVLSFIMYGASQLVMYLKRDSCEKDPLISGALAVAHTAKNTLQYTSNSLSTTPRITWTQVRSHGHSHNITPPNKKPPPFVIYPLSPPFYLSLRLCPSRTSTLAPIAPTPAHREWLHDLQLVSLCPRPQTHSETHARHSLLLARTNSRSRACSHTTNTTPNPHLVL